MRPAKEEAIRLIRSLPDDCSLDEIQYHLSVIRKVGAGLADVKAGRTVSQEEAERRVAGWAGSMGRDRPSAT